MQITVDEAFRKELIDKIQQREFSERTGIHCSDLIYCLNKQALRKSVDVPDEDATILLYSLGWATQRWLTGKDEDVPEKEIDGIKVTLDALTLDVRDKTLPDDATNAMAWVPWELKATFQSNNKPIAENTHWIRQIMAQCYVVAANTAYLTRFELMGNWKFNKKGEPPDPANRRPTLTAFKFEFNQKELDANWKWLLERKEVYEKILETGKLVPKIVAIPTGQSFECSYCIFAGKECSL